MKTFPMFLRTTGRRIVVVGGGETATQKVRLALKTDAHIVVAAPELDAELQAVVHDGRAAHWRGPISAATFENAAVAFIATGCPGASAAISDIARNAGALVNVVDVPDLCDAFTPSIVDRDPVVVAIGTEGTAPVLARRIRADIETMMEPRLGALAALAGRLRAAVSDGIARDRRRAFWHWVFTGTPRTLYAAGRERDAVALVKSAIAAGGADQADDAGFVSLVGAGPGSRDLLTLRAVERLQEADGCWQTNSNQSQLGQ